MAELGLKRLTKAQWELVKTALANAKPVNLKQWKRSTDEHRNDAGNSSSN